MAPIDQIDVQGIKRSKRDAKGQLLGSDDEQIRLFWRAFNDSLAVDDHGRPLVFAHGTGAQFDQFSPSAHRTILNDKYQGDAFHFSTETDVARKYAFAARNQVMNKERTYEALDKSVPPDLAAVFKSVVERGYSATWDIPEAEVDQILSSAKRAGIDLNDLLDLAEYVEGSNYDLGRERQFDAGMIFGGNVRYFPDWARESAEHFGLSEGVPTPRIVFSYLRCHNLLRTSDRDAARNAKANGYDSVLYEGHDLVDGVSEWSVYDETQILLIGSLENLHTDKPTWKPGGLEALLRSGQADAITVKPTNPRNNALVQSESRREPQRGPLLSLLSKSTTDVQTILRRNTP